MYVWSDPSKLRIDVNNAAVHGGATQVRRVPWPHDCYHVAKSLSYKIYGFYVLQAFSIAISLDDGKSHHPELMG